MLAPWTSPSVIARASIAGAPLGPTLSVIGVAVSVSARKPMVCAFAMLLAITRWRTIDPFMPE